MKPIIKLLSDFPSLQTTTRAVIVIVLVCACSCARAADMNHSIHLGYDSFIDRFTILEGDTVEVIDEFYAGMLNRFSFNSDGTKVALRNNFKFGTQTVDEILDGEIALGLKNKTRFELRSSLRLKFFREGSNYSFGNDYIQSNTFFKLRRSFSNKHRLNLRSRFEILEYEERTEFDYDYRYIDAGLEYEVGSVLGSAVRIGGFIGYRETPDTLLSYQRTLADLDVRISSGYGTYFQMNVTGDRRDYRENVRSSYWSVLSYASLMAARLSGRTYYFNVESELTVYDKPTDIFFDTHFIRGSVRGSFPVGETVSLYLEPRYARMLCRHLKEEQYWETSAILGMDIMRSGNLWISAAYEPGYRGYVLEENELYSDFYFNRITLMGNVGLAGGFSFNLLFSHDPERHSRRDDDFSLTLISVTLMKRF